MSSNSNESADDPPAPDPPEDKAAAGDAAEASAAADPAVEPNGDAVDDDPAVSAAEQPPPPPPPPPPPIQLSEREQVLEQYRNKIKEHREVEARLKRMREDVKGLVARYTKTEDDLAALQSVGQIIGDVLKRLDGPITSSRKENKDPSHKSHLISNQNKSSSSSSNSGGGNSDNERRFIVKASSGPRYVVGCRSRLNAAALKPGTRVALDMTTLTIMRVLPREVDPTVFHMQTGEQDGGVSFADIGGLSEQIRELREVIELPLTNPELFVRVGIKAPKGVLLYGPPGTGKTLLARALASNINATFLKVVASAIVDKYIGESARIVREMFAFARDHEPCVIFMDEIDAIGGSRFAEGTSADREIQRTLMELLNQMDGFESHGQVKMVMATNRPDILDPALLRPGRLDRKIEIPEPNETQRLEILKIHAASITVRGDIDYESVVKLADGLNGADMRNVCTEAGLFAIRNDRDYVLEEDFMKAARKILDNKKLESKLDYSKV
jgi:26S proteasome regulatory subunit T4